MPAAPSPAEIAADREGDEPPVDAEEARALGRVRRRAGFGHALGVWVGRQMLRLPWLTKFSLTRRRERGLLMDAGAQYGTAVGADGVPIAYAYLPPDPKIERRDGVVFLHGWMETKEFHADTARLLASRGHPVLLADLRHHGGSGGPFVTFGVKERHDVETLIDLGLASGWFTPPVVTMGFSTGAVSVLAHLAVDRERPRRRVGACCALAPMVSLRRGVKWFRGMAAPRVAERWLMLGVAEAVRRAGMTFDQTELRDVVRAEDRPILFAAGEHGSRFTLGDQVRDLVKVKTDGWTDLHTVPGVTHFAVGTHAWPDILPPWERMLAEMHAHSGEAGIWEPSPVDPTSEVQRVRVDFDPPPGRPAQQAQG